ncbi:MAG: Jag N-terminal domain-containing protein, partial [Oscillospiraceae bacterium]|nr:Jag N-terminal domain-containing protein [Oscillospiraceae bacterium]
MLKYMEFTAKTEDEAIAKGLTHLGLDRDDVSVEILERGKTGFLGIGSVPAKVKLTYVAPDEPQLVPARPAEAKP